MRRDIQPSVREEQVQTVGAQKQQELEDFFATFDEDALKQQVETCIRKGALRNGKS